ncbi:hypothetical protein GCM10027191_25450 [Novilysobacter erysipheiresistens]
MQTTCPDYMRLSLVVMLALAAGGCDAKQRMLDAVVRQSGQLPCFSVPTESLRDKDELTVAGIQVSELDEREQVRGTTWTGDFTLSEPPTLLSPETCIPYGTLESGRTVGPLIPIEPGRHYTVFINAHVRRGEEWQNRSYSGYFCVAKDAMQRHLVREVQWDKALGRRRWDGCGQVSLP